MKDSSHFRIHVHLGMQILLVLPVLLTSLFLLYIFFKIPSVFLGFVFILTFALTWYLISLASSYIEVDDKSITVKVIRKKYMIQWDEVRKIITNDTLYSLQGEDKQLSVSLMLAGKNKKDFYRLLGEKVKSYGIEIEQTDNVPLLHRNTRI